MRPAPCRALSPQVLLVEDDDLLVEVMETALKREGYRFQAVRTGDEAVSAAYRLKPQVALLDVKLPGQSGYLVAAKLKLVRPAPRIIFLTVLPRGQSDLISSLLCVDAILHKPIGVKKVLDEISRSLAYVQAMRAA